MKTKWTRVTALLLAAAMMCTLAGCGKAPDRAEDNPVDSTVRGPGYDDLIESDTLVIYSMMEYSNLDQRTVNLFTTATGISVEVVLVPIAEFDERILNDLAAGGGPDILFLDELYDLNMEKAARSHQFLDLTDILAEDPDFHREDYLSGIFEDCRIEGRQYSVPISFSAPLLISSEMMLDGFHFRWDRVDTTADFLSQIAKLTPGAKNFKGFRQMMLFQNQFNIFCMFSGIPLIDYASGTVLPDEKGLQAFLEAYRDYFPFDYDPNAVSPTEWPHDLLSDGACLFYDADVIEDILVAIDILQEHHHTDVTHLLPGQDGTYVGSVSREAVIRANSPNSKNAYEFLKFLLSEEAQKDRFVILGSPIRKTALEYSVRESDGHFTNRGYIQYDYDNTALTEEEADDLLAKLYDIDRFRRREYLMMDMLFDTMLPYFKDEDSYKNCLEELRSKLTFYLSE